MTDAIQQTAADTATEAAIESVVTNAPPAQTEAAFNRASVLHRRSAPGDDGSPPTEQSWRDGSDAQPLSPMPAAPTIGTSEIDSAIAKLNDMGGDHAALVHEWQTTGANVGEELAYAKAAFRSLATNDPDLIARVDASGLGNHPTVLKFLAKQGRLDAGRLGDFTISRNSNESHIPMNTPRAGSIGNNGSLETRGELNRLLAANPPGSMGYRDQATQSRIQQLYQTLAGSGNPVGVGGRRA